METMKFLVGALTVVMVLCGWVSASPLNHRSRATLRKSPALNSHHPQRIIIDTDMGFDVDDVGALCLAHSLQDHGLVDIMATVHNTGCKLGIGGVSAINHYYNRDNITLGAWKGKFGSNCDKHYEGTSGQDQYLSKIIDKMGGPVKNSSQVMLGVDAYRKALAAAPNNSVHIASIGMTTNLADLLDTQADQYSSLSGYDLIAAKVSKIVWMDGGYNFGCAAGNIGPAYECYGTAQRALKMPPSVSMVFSEAGSSPPIYTGAGLQSHHPALASPCREAYKNWCCNPNGEGGTSGRLSWDPITTMIASLGVSAVYEAEIERGINVTASANGDEHFFGNGTKNARTAFSNSVHNVPEKISRKINGYLDVPPGAGGNWTFHQGLNCWGKRGTGVFHGAKDLEHPAWASCGAFDTMQECESKCEELGSVCQGVVTWFTNGKYNCYRKGDIHLGECQTGTYFDMWTRATSTQKRPGN